MTRAGEHRWAVRRLVAREAGLLSGEEEAQLDEHLSHCDRCRELLAHSDDDGQAFIETDGHIPPVMLVHWEKTRQGVSGLERELIAKHLEDCPACRADLEFLGFQPSLEEAPAPVSQPVIARPAWGKSSRWSWLSFGWAVAATAALVVLLVLPGRETGLIESSIQGAVPWVSPARSRGAGARNTLALPEEARRIALAVAIPGALQAAESVEVEIFGPDGGRLLRTTVIPAQLRQATVMVVLETASPLEEGGYRVVLREAGAAGDAAHAEELIFEITRPTH